MVWPSTYSTATTAATFPATGTKFASSAATVYAIIALKSTSCRMQSTTPGATIAASIEPTTAPTRAANFAVCRLRSASTAATNAATIVASIFATISTVLACRSISSSPIIGRTAAPTLCAKTTAWSTTRCTV